MSIDTCHPPAIKIIEEHNRILQTYSIHEKEITFISFSNSNIEIILVDTENLCLELNEGSYLLFN